MKKISWSCVIIGIISIVLSISAIPWGYLSLPFQFLVNSLQFGSIAVPRMHSIVCNNLLLFFDYFFSIVLIVSGLGTILVRRWGKILAYIYSLTLIILSIIGLLIIPFGYMTMYDQMNKQGSLSLIPVYFGAWGYIIALIGTLFYPIVLLIFFSRPKIKEKFAKKK